MHTQGKWKVSQEDTGLYSVNADNGRHWKHIGTTTANGDGTDQVTDAEARANADLFAAAPGLLSCLQAILSLPPRDRSSINVEVGIETAIAKATGK